MSGFGNGIRFMMCRPSRLYMCDHDNPLWDGALLTTLVGASKEATLLVAGVICDHSHDGVIPRRSTMPFLRVPGTPLVPAWMIRSRVGARKTYIMWDGYQSSGPFL